MVKGKDPGLRERPPGRWWVRITHQGKTHEFGHFTSKATARNFRDDARAKIRQERFFPEEYQRHQTRKVTVGKWIDQYMESCTLKSIKDIQTKADWWKEKLGTFPLTRVKSQDLRKIQADLDRTGTWSQATINRYFAFLKRIFTLAVHDDLVVKNPVLSVVFFPEPDGPDRFLSEAEEKDLSEKMTPEDFELVEMALQSGFRLEEQFQLRWDCINFESRFAITGLTKNKTRIKKFMTSRAVELLRKRSTHLYSPYVYPNPKNPSKPMSGGWFKKSRYDPALKAAGIEGVTWHTLKHTVASRLVMGGISDRALMEFMGWKDRKMVQRYAHLSPSYMGKVGEILAKNWVKTGEAAQTESQPVS